MNAVEFCPPPTSNPTARSASDESLTPRSKVRDQVVPDPEKYCLLQGQTESQFLKYVKITNTEKADKLKEYWNKQNEEQKIEAKKTRKVK